MPTSAADPERARRQREQYPPPDEADWRGLLYGLGAALGVIAGIVGVTHIIVRWF